MRAAVALLLVLAGCLGGGGEPVRATGSPASLPPDATGEYEAAGETNRTLNATVTVTLAADVEGRESTDVAATVPVATYRRATDPPAVLAVASSPRVEVVENPPAYGDPLGTLPPAELVPFVQATYAEPTELSETDEATVAVLGTGATLRTYRGSAVLDGESVPVRVHVVRVTHGGDVVTAVAVHGADASEQDRIGSLLGELRHAGHTSTE